MTRFLFGLLAGVVLADLTNPAGSDLSDWLAGKPPTLVEASCSTDSECQKLCPQEDKDCDGGPEPLAAPVRVQLKCWPAWNKRYVRCE